MNKKIAAVSLSLLSVVCLASCAEEVTLADVTAQAAKYDASAVSEEYSGCTISSEIYFESDNETVASICSLIFGVESGEKKTDETTVPVAVATADDLGIDLSGLDADFESEHVKYYLDGAAIKIEIDYEGSFLYQIGTTAYNVDGSVDYEFSTYDDGRIKKISTEIEFYYQTLGDFEYSAVYKYSYTKA